MGREEVVEREYWERERKIKERKEGKGKGRTDGWTGVVLLCLRVLLLGLRRLVWSFLNLWNKKDNQSESFFADRGGQV